MPCIYLKTTIEAPIELVFDLSRSVDAHLQSTSQTNEKVISGKKHGLLHLNDTITWRAKHLGIYQNLTVKITQMNVPNSFIDEMQKGAFKQFIHVHRFERLGEKTVMYDEFQFTSPMGWIGKLIDQLFLKRYMREFLILRNNHIKAKAEQKKSA